MSKMTEMKIVYKLLKKEPQLFLLTLLEQQSQLQLSAEELLLIQFLWLELTQNNVSPSNNYLATLLHWEEQTVRQTITSLLQKEQLHLVTKEDNGKMVEHYDLSPIINRCFSRKITPTQPTQGVKEFVFEIETEFQRQLSPIEIQYIHNWIYDEHISLEILKEALKETVLSGVKNFKYMNAIIHNWHATKAADQYGLNFKAYKQSKQKEFTQEERAIAEVDWKKVLQDDK